MKIKVNTNMLVIASLLAVPYLIILADSAESDANPRASLAPARRRLLMAVGPSNSSPQRHEVRPKSQSAELSGVNQAVLVENVLKDLEANCSVQREPRFSKNPSVHFYSYKAHSLETGGCGSNIEIELDPVDGVLSQKPKLDRMKLREVLVDSDLFDANVETYFITHGFQGSWNGTAWMCTLKDVVLSNGAANVFIVDWSGGSRPVVRYDYTTAASNTLYVGAVLGELIRSLIELTGQRDASQYHMIGHSLGSHISGHAGYYLQGELGRITALDPAGPCFNAKSGSAKTAVEDGFLDRLGGSRRRRLSRQSAKLVVALHTHGRLYGLMENCAHYDVYVNGGYKQSLCESPLTSVKSSLPSGCSHAYAASLLNQFVEAGQAPETELARQRHSKVADKCYPIAYQCADWKSFKAGECGFCKDGDSRCVHVGLGSGKYQTSDVFNFGYGRDSTSQSNSDDGDDDGDDDSLFNREDEIGGIPDHRQGKHFMRAGPAPVTCLYHYQIIIATRKQVGGEPPNDSTKDIYHLHIPLELSGQLTDEQGNKLKSRLVQVSHRLPSGSTAYKYLLSTYMNGSAKQDSRDELEFYTALITFEPILSAKRCLNDPTNGAGRRDKWQICSPLDNIQEIRLWSSRDDKLNAVLWVGMNYMSGLNYEQRLAMSYLFT